MQIYCCPPLFCHTLHHLCEQTKKKRLSDEKIAAFQLSSPCTAHCEAVISVKNKFVSANKAPSFVASTHNMASESGATRCSLCAARWETTMHNYKP